MPDVIERSRPYWRYSASEAGQQAAHVAPELREDACRGVFVDPAGALPFGMRGRERGPGDLAGGPGCPGAGHVAQDRFQASFVLRQPRDGQGRKVFQRIGPALQDGDLDLRPVRPGHGKFPRLQDYRRRSRRGLLS